MTDYTRLTRMAPASVVNTARQFCEAMAEGDAGKGELHTGLVPVGSPPGTEPTWYITDGPIDVLMAACMKDPEVMHTKCVESGIPASLEDCQGLLSLCVVTERGGWEMMAEMGLQLPNSAGDA